MLYRGESCLSVVCVADSMYGVLNCGLLSSCRCVCVCEKACVTHVEIFYTVQHTH